MIFGEATLAETFTAFTALAVIVVDAVRAGSLLGTHVETEVVLVAGTLKIRNARRGGVQQRKQGDEKNKDKG